MRYSPGKGSRFSVLTRFRNELRPPRIEVGDSGCGGPSLADLQARSQRLRVGVPFLFIPPANEVAPLLKGIDIFVLPSLSEALSNSLMEAMACS